MTNAQTTGAQIQSAIDDPERSLPIVAAIEHRYGFTAEVKTKGRQQNADGWAITVDWKLPGSKYDLVLYGTDWETVAGHEVGQTANITIERGNLKTTKDGKYSSDYFWDMVSIEPGAMALAVEAVQAPPKPGPTPPPPVPAALGACHNHAVDFIVRGILPVPEGRELFGWVRELRDRFYREINQAPVAPLHYCYEHNEDRRQGKTGAWGHLLPPESDAAEDAYCIEGREGWRTFNAGS